MEKTVTHKKRHPPRRLTDADCKRATCRPGTKGTCYSDGQGLYLLVTPHGYKSWRATYTLNGKQRHVVLGSYPLMSIEEARRGLVKVKAAVLEGRDICAERRERKRALAAKSAVDEVGSLPLCDAVRAWGTHKTRAALWEGFTDSQREQWFQGASLPKSIGKSERRAYERLFRAFRSIWKQPMASLTAVSVERLLNAHPSPGEAEHALAYLTGERGVYEHWRRHHRAVFPNLLDGVVLSAHHVQGNFAAITDPLLFGACVRSLIHDRATLPCTRPLVQVLAYLFQRPGQVCAMEWTQVDFDRGIWFCPQAATKQTARVKAKSAKLAAQGRAEGFHYVPLPRQVVEILWSLRPLTGAGRYVFTRRDGKPFETTSLSARLKRGPYGGKQTLHGFRASAVSILSSLFSVDKDVLEAQLNHALDAKYRGAYYRADFFEQRVQLAQVWADLLDHLIDGRAVASFRPHIQIQRRELSLPLPSSSLPALGLPVLQPVEEITHEL